MKGGKLKKFSIKNNRRKDIIDPISDWISWCMVVFGNYNNGNLCWIEGLYDWQWKKVVKLIKEISEDWQKKSQYNSCHTTKQMNLPFQREYSFLNNYSNETILEFIISQWQKPSRVIENKYLIIRIIYNHLFIS